MTVVAETGVVSDAAARHRMPKLAGRHQKLERSREIPGEMTQSVECLPCKHEDLRLIPRVQVRKHWVLWCPLAVPALGRSRLMRETISKAGCS